MTWVLVLMMLHPVPIVAVLLLAACAVLAALGGRHYLRRRCARRIGAFSEQLEGVLRTLAGGVRVGLGIRQALVLTSEQSREPAKSELMRVVGLSSLGMSMLDAFDQLAARMTDDRDRGAGARRARAVADRRRSRQGARRAGRNDPRPPPLAPPREGDHRARPRDRRGCWAFFRWRSARSRSPRTSCAARCSTRSSAASSSAPRSFLDALAIFTLTKITRIDA